MEDSLRREMWSSNYELILWIKNFYRFLIVEIIIFFYVSVIFLEIFVI